MPVYTYKAIDSKGHKHAGQVFVSSFSVLLEDLKKKGLYLTSSQCRRSRSYFSFRKAPSLQDLSQFCQHLYQLDQIGVPLSLALEDASYNTKNKRLKAVICELHQALQKGTLFAKAIAAYPKTFPPIFSQLIQSAEKVGRFSAAFQQIEEHLTWTHGFNQRRSRALRYPLILLGLFAVMIGVVWTVLLPNLELYFYAVGITDLPRLTHSLLRLGTFCEAWALPSLIGVLLCIVLFGISLKLSTRLSERFEKACLSIPIWGPFRKGFAVAEALHTVGALLESKIDLLSSLQHIADHTTYRWLRCVFSEIHQAVTKGALLSLAFRDAKLLPPLFLQFIKLGEQTGELAPLLKRASLQHKNSLLERLEKAISLLQPTLILLMGGIMLLLVVAVMLPLYDSLEGLY